MCGVRANQNPESPVRTRPRSGISVGRTTSKVEMRSLATSNKRSSSIDATGDLRVASDKLHEVGLLVPRAHRVTLDDAIGVVARQPRVDESEQETMTEEQMVARIEISPHPFGMDDKAVDDPAEPVEHVIEDEERVWDHDAFRGGLRDVALVPQRHVLEADECVRPHDSCETADALRDLWVALVRHGRRPFHPFAERLLDLTDLGPREVPDLGGEALQRRCRERKR